MLEKLALSKKKEIPGIIFVIDNYSFWLINLRM